jgi:hypothetical protein
MSQISALTEDFEGGTNGAAVTTSNSIFDNKTGTGSVTFNTDAYRGSLAMNISPVADNVVLRADFTAATTLWVGFYMKVVTAPAATTAIMNWYSGTTKIGDLRVGADGTLSLRDGNSQVWAASTPLTIGAWHRIAVKVVPNTATGHRVKIYSGTNLDGSTASQDSGNLAATASGVTNVDNVRFGLISVDTATVRIDRIRADNAVETAGVGTGAVTANAGVDQTNIEPYTTITLTGVGTGGTTPYTYNWTQTAGTPTVTLSGSGASRTFAATALLIGAMLTFQLTVTDSASATATDTVDVNVLVHNQFTRVGGAWVPYDIKSRAGGTWQSY